VKNLKLKRKRDKCPKCGGTETIHESFRHDQGFIEEYWDACKKCGNLKNHWSYGCQYVADWKDGFKIPLLHRFKNRWQKIKSFFRFKRKKTDDDLPF